MLGDGERRDAREIDRMPRLVTHCSRSGHDAIAPRRRYCACTRAI